MPRPNRQGGDADYRHLAAYRAGQLARSAGRPLTVNPYRDRAGYVVARNAWAAGWRHEASACKETHSPPNPK